MTYDEWAPTRAEYAQLNVEQAASRMGQAFIVEAKRQAAGLNLSPDVMPLALVLAAAALQAENHGVASLQGWFGDVLQIMARGVQMAPTSQE